MLETDRALHTVAMWFCPVDGTLLLVDQRPGADGVIAAGHGTCFCCPVCPYVYHLTQRRTVRVRTKRKEVDDIMVSTARAKSARVWRVANARRSHARARPSPVTLRTVGRGLGERGQNRGAVSKLQVRPPRGTVQNVPDALGRRADDLFLQVREVRGAMEGRLTEKRRGQRAASHYARYTLL